MANRNYLIATLFTIVISVSTNRKVRFYIRDALYFYHMAIFRVDFVKIEDGNHLRIFIKEGIFPHEMCFIYGQLYTFML